ncbi:MAG: helix-turn-helix domain-containing protein [Candidatus Tectimicrobiota bacterium]
MTTSVKEKILALNIGPKIKRLRKDRHLTLQDLSSKTGLSKPLLSQVENSLVIPPLPTLLKISNALKVPMTHFITDEYEDRVMVVRGNEVSGAPKRLVDGRDPSNYFYSSLLKGKTNKKMEPLYVEFSQVAKGKLAPLAHPGEEFIHVLEGQLEVSYDETVVVLEAGDSLYLDGRISHSYRSLTKRRTRAIMVIAE